MLSNSTVRMVDITSADDDHGFGADATANTEVNPMWTWQQCEPDPNGEWLLADDGIYHNVTRGGVVRPERISGRKLYIEDRAVDVDTGLESVTVVWMDGSRVRRYTGPRKDLSSIRGVMELANRGYSVNTGNARHIVAYLAHLLDWHQDDIPIRYIVSSCGTKEINGSRIFVVGNNVVSDDDDAMNASFNPHSGAGEVIDNLRSKNGGKLSNWVATAREMDEYPTIAFGVMAAFLPPLLKDLQVSQNPIIDYGGVSSTGKTTALKLCASVWGYPLESDAGLVRSWSGTKVFFERYAAVMNELPIYLDESHKADPKEVADVVYHYANGSGRGRGTIAGMQPHTHYKGVLFSAGESKLADVGTTDGIQARVVGFWGSPFPEGHRELVNQINRVSEKDFGLAGKAVLEHYLRHRDQLLPFLAQMKARTADALAERAVDDIGRRLADIFGAVCAAGWLANSVLELEWDVEAVVFEAFSHISESRRSSSAQEAIELVGSWIAANPSKFHDGGSGEICGRTFVDRRDGQERIAVTPHILQSFLAQNKYSYSSIVSQWKDRGWIDVENGRNHKKVRLNGSFAYMVVLNHRGIAASRGGDSNEND